MQNTFRNFSKRRIEFGVEMQLLSIYDLFAGDHVIE